MIHITSTTEQQSIALWMIRRRHRLHNVLTIARLYKFTIFSWSTVILKYVISETRNIVLCRKNVLIRHIIRKLFQHIIKYACQISKSNYESIVPIFVIIIIRLLHYELAKSISMTWCKIAVTPLLTHWSYCNIALSHRYDNVINVHVISVCIVYLFVFLCVNGTASAYSTSYDI